MKGKRTQADFSEHVMTETLSEHVKIWELKLPDSYTHSFTFINCKGVMTVTGDFGNYVFNREFHPSAKGFVSDGYWVEKMKLYSCQEPYEFDHDKTAEAIDEFEQDLIADDELDNERKDYIDSLRHANYNVEWMYDSTAYDYPCPVEAEAVPKGYVLHRYLLYVFDAFEEICRRMKEPQQ